MIYFSDSVVSPLIRLNIMLSCRDQTPESVVGEAWTMRVFEHAAFPGEPDEYFNYRGPIATTRKRGVRISVVGYRIQNGG